MSTMDRTHGSWWIFRLRTPAGFVHAPVLRREIMAFGLLLSLVLLVLFLLLDGFFPVIGATDLPGTRVDCRYLIPILLGLVGIVAGLFTPTPWCERTGIAGLLQAARERGNLGTFDSAVLLLGVPIQFWSLFHVDHLFMTRVVLLLMYAAALLMLLRQPRVDFSQRKRKYNIPDWLWPKAPLPDGSEKPTPGVEPAPGPEPVPVPVPVGPDPGSNCQYRFALTSGTQEREFGVFVPGSLLDTLRLINGEYKGRLFNENPHAVVLMDREPADQAEAREIVLSLSRQLALEGSGAGLNRYEMAVAILKFVQTCFTYVHDDVSTGGFPPDGPYSEYGRFPVETINDRHGDCECTAILCASLLAYAGFRSALINVKLINLETGKVTYHAAVGLSPDDLFAVNPDENIELIADPQDTSRRFLYGETTAGEYGPGFGVRPNSLEKNMEVEEVYEFFLSEY